jgi:penicillin amidase
LNFSRLVLRLILGRRLPFTSGTLRLAGPHDTLRIRRDRWGTPYVEASSEHDAYFGIGFCHGQDRAFQLELLARVARGSLSELVGPRALPIDRLSRRIGFHHAAAQQWPILSDEVRAMLEAYAQGVNAGTSHGSPRRAHEFVLLRAWPTPWTALDSLALVKVISFTLASNWDVELVRLKVLQEDGPEALAALDPAYAHWLPVTAPVGQAAGASLDRLAEELAAFTGAAGTGRGSNNWVVDASRTATGRPILANDPHLAANLPPHWYLVQARTPQWSVAGASFLGGPAVQAGHNGHIAWGVTAGLIDNTDFFREEVGPDGASVREGDRFVHCPIREEVIRVRGGAAVTERVLVTPRGPIVSPAMDGFREALSLRAVWLDALPLDGLLRLQRLRSFEEFRRAAADWPAASQNMVYADAAGTIGWQMFGPAPRRRKYWGLVPAPGWDPEGGWEADLVPADELPHTVNPPGGFLVTANNQPRPEGAGPFLGADWLDGYRAATIARRLADRTDWNVARTQELQLDQQALAWEDMREAVLSVPDKDADARQALALLRDWDGRVAADSPAAAVYELFLAEMAGRVARAKAPRSHAWILGQAVGSLTSYNFFCYRRTAHLARLLREQPEGWFGRPWPDEIADALAAVVQRLRSRHGSDPGGWAWGRLRSLVMHHPMGRRGLLRGVFNLGPIPFGGDADTINQAAALPLEPLAPTDNIASLRMVIDVGAWDNSRFVLPGGQSGNPLSPHYDDQFPLWQRGEGVAIAWTDDAIRQATRETLELIPG